MGAGIRFGALGGNMGVSKLSAFSVVLVLGAGLALTQSGVALAASPGLVKASGQTVRGIVGDIGLSVPARCVVAEQARSNRAWGLYSLRSGGGCNPVDGYTVIHRSGGSWKALPLGGSSVPCSALKAGLADADAPASVFRDFKAGGACTRGE